MAINFPSSPTTNQTYTYNSKTWTWNGVAWDLSYGATANNIAGGVANQILYQSATGTTSFVPAPSVSSTYLQWNGTAFTWAASVGTTTNALTFNNGGAGAASGTTFNGSAAQTISYNTVGAPSTTGTNASGTWGISITGNAATVTNGMYVGGGTFTGAVTGATLSLNNALNNNTNNGSFTCRSTGTGDTNLAGMSFYNDSYAIKLGIRADGYFGLGGWSRNPWSWYSAPDGSMVAAGNITAYSDPRLKENFQRIEDPLKILNSLRGGTFNWKAGIVHTAVKAGKRDYGLLADEVEAVMPEIVTDSIEIDGEVYKTVSYEKLVPVLLEAIKTLETRVKELESRENK